jgi:dipeptidase D
MKPGDFPTEPAELWRHFYDITQIPRPSGEEAALREHIIALAERRDCKWQTDSSGNLLVHVPASEGRGRDAAVIIQNHLDMVTVKTEDKAHDFSRDPLQLSVEDGWLKADRTTLGADNGLGCAAALALLTDASLEHPPLQLLFTVEEETGLYGASGLDAGMLDAPLMLNLDTEDWGELFVGCAGARGWIFRRPLERGQARPGSAFWQLNLRGLSGGHSGIQIHHQLGNAIKLLGQWLGEAESESLELQVTGFEGGIAHNVIPREASVSFCCAEDSAAALQALNNTMLERWRSYLPAADHGMELELCEAEPAVPLAAADQALLQQLLLVFPHGARNYSLENPADLVDLSINMAVVRVDEAGLFLESTLRFFNEREAQALVQEVLAHARWLGAEVQDTVDYPGWQPDFDSPLLARTRALHEELFGSAPAVKAIHAGLECGILKNKLKSRAPDVDIISFGPTIRGAHSPTERLDIATVAPFWKLLTGLLKRL